MDGSMVSPAADTIGRPMPRQAVPPLILPPLGGSTFDLAAETPERFTLVDRLTYPARGEA